MRIAASGRLIGGCDDGGHKGFLMEPLKKRNG